MLNRAILATLCCLALSTTVRAGTTTSDFMNALPPVVRDTMKAADCTVIYLVTDVTTNDMLAVRMQIAPDANDQPVNEVMPCPPDMPPRVAARALDACAIRAADPKNCVFADMGRDFERSPKPDNTAENRSRCASDQATDIGVACWLSGELQVCDVGCGKNPSTAISAAVERCEAKHQKQCSITGSLPVLAPK